MHEIYKSPLLNETAICCMIDIFFADHKVYNCLVSSTLHSTATSVVIGSNCSAFLQIFGGHAKERLTAEQ